MALVVLSALLVGSMWIVPYLPTNDGPEWIFATHAENHYGDPGTPYREALTPSPQFASRGMSLVYGPFEAWLGWQRGLQVALGVILLTAAWGFVALVHALERERWPMGLLGFPLALTWEFYMGLWPFTVAAAFGLVILAVAVRFRNPTWKERLALAALLLFQAVAHVFGAVLTGAVMLLVAVARAPRGKRLAETARVALTGAPAAGILVACVWVSLKEPLSALARDFDRVPWRDAIAMFPRTVAPGSLPRALVFTLAVLAATVLAGVRVFRKGTDDTERGLGVAAVVLLLLGMFTPFQIPGWQAFSERFVPLGAALALALVPVERLSGLARTVPPAALFVAAVAYLGLTYPFHRRLVALCPDAVAGLQTTFRTNGTLFPVLFRATEHPTHDHIRAEVPFMNPLLHMGSVYATVLGGIPASGFAGAVAIHAFSRRPGSRPLPDIEHYTRVLNSYEFRSDLAYRDVAENELASFGMFYDETVVFGAIPSDLALWRERGYVADWKGKTTLLAHFEPCTIDFTVPAAASDPAPVFDVHVGVIGLLTGVRVPKLVDEDGLSHFVLAPAPCGHVEVRARWETPGAAPLFCKNANAEGDITAKVTRKSHVVTCDGPPGA